MGDRSPLAARSAGFDVSGLHGRLSGRDPDAERAGPDDEPERRAELDGLAVDAGVGRGASPTRSSLRDLSCRPPGPPSMSELLEIRLLGPFEVLAGGTRADVGGSKRQALLAMLALRQGRVVDVDALVDGLWGEELPAAPRNALHHHIARLRAALGGGARSDPASRPTGTRWSGARVDAGRLEASSAAGDARAPNGRVSTSTGSSTASGARSSRPPRGTRSIITSPASAPRSERSRSSARPTGTPSRTRASTPCGSRSCSRRRAPRCATATPLPRRTQSRRRWPSGADRRCRV